MKSTLSWCQITIALNNFEIKQSDLTLSKIYSDDLTRAQQDNEAPLTFDFVDVNQLEMARPRKIRGKER